MIFSLYIPSFICANRLNHATNKKEWMLDESIYWASGFGVALILAVWILFRLNDLMNWYYRTRVAIDRAKT